MQEVRMNRRGQIGETMTWMFATIVIIFMTFLFLFLVTLLKPAGIQIDTLAGEDSGFVEQEMLFAILEHSVDGISVRELVLSREFGRVESRIEVILGKFSEKGINCDFEVVGFVDVKKGGTGKTVSINVEGREVTLKC